MGGCVSTQTDNSNKDKSKSTNTLPKQTTIKKENSKSTLKKANKQIEQGLSRAKQSSIFKVKLLLLGAGESGKSTLLKQMRAIHGLTYSRNELYSVKPHLTQNVIEAMRTLAVYSDVLADRGYTTRVTQPNLMIRDRVARMSDKQLFTQQHCDDFKKLFKDPGIQETIKYRNEFQLIDTVEYLFENMQNYVDADYVPKFTDLIHCRQRTSGVNKLQFQVKDRNNELSEIFQIYDVGGQRNERKKWIHFFDDTTAIIFVAALSGYNQTLWEENAKNRMLEAIGLFNSIINLSNIKGTNIILFLNKEDLFYKKIASKLEYNKLSNYFKDFKGNNWNKFEVIEFFKKKFLKQCRSEKNAEPLSKKIFFHLTNATDTECVKNMFASCRKILIKKSLSFAQLL